MRINFGKYKGQDIEDVPASYLAWLGEQDFIGKFPDVKNYIEKNRKGIEKQIEDGNGEQ
jgi:uncharacterized protein (DUF3820 family)